MADMNSSEPDLASFLFARIADDEKAAREALEPDLFGEDPSFYSSFGAHRDDWGMWTFNVPVARVLAECEAKRRVVELHPEGDHDCPGQDWTRWPPGPCLTLRALALPHADHPDFREEWRP